MRLIAIGLLCFVSCTNAADLELEKKALLEQHEQSKKHHFERNAAALVRDNADPFISVSNGSIDSSRRADAERMFTEYLKDAEYLNYDDLHPPVIRISPDGQMAWMITRTKVLRRKNYDGKTQQEGFIYAGIMTYAKKNGKWMREANVSTFAAMEPL
jgi:hypothetical protein